LFKAVRRLIPNERERKERKKEYSQKYARRLAIEKSRVRAFNVLLLKAQFEMCNSFRLNVAANKMMMLDALTEEQRAMYEEMERLSRVERGVDDNGKFKSLDAFYSRFERMMRSGVVRRERDGTSSLKMMPEMPEDKDFWLTALGYSDELRDKIISGGGGESFWNLVREMALAKWEAKWEATNRIKS
jgi:hypothetical protein